MGLMDGRWRGEVERVGGFEGRRDRMGAGCWVGVWEFKEGS